MKLPSADELVVLSLSPTTIQKNSLVPATHAQKVGTTHQGVSRLWIALYLAQEVGA
jgi:hypothetical protein